MMVQYRKNKEIGGQLIRWLNINGTAIANHTASTVVFSDTSTTWWKRTASLSSTLLSTVSSHVLAPPPQLPLTTPFISHAPPRHSLVRRGIGAQLRVTDAAFCNQVCPVSSTVDMIPLV